MKLRRAKERKEIRHERRGDSYFYCLEGLKAQIGWKMDADLVVGRGYITEKIVKVAQCVFMNAYGRAQPEFNFEIVVTKESFKDT